MNIVLIGLIVIIALLVLSSFFTVEQQKVAIIERLGKFVRVARPGLNTKIPLLERVAGRVSLRIQQLNIAVDTKTSDNVFVHMTVSIQYAAIPDHVYEAFYKLSDPEKQIQAYVFDVVRAQVPSITLDEVFEKKEQIALAVGKELAETMKEFGFSILKALVTDIDPDEKVKAAMNEINAATRLRVAANEKGEAEKILKVKQAEGEAESMRLQGEGLAKARQAIIYGLKDSVEDFRKAVPEATANSVMNLVLTTQYYDTLKEIGANNRSSVILTPGKAENLSDHLREAVITGNIVNKLSN
ncbi:MAG: SPFH domain-containing protein [Gammaproteobacteria bacterium]|nr:SPFH domain-containing protein [Gammaproteobacteria bacterium]